MNHRLVLTADQSAFLRGCGKHFALATVGSYPDATGRHVLYLVECDAKAAQGALDVAQGLARAVKLPTPRAET